MPEPIIVLDNLRKVYGRTIAADNLTMSVPPGEIPAQPGCSYFELSREGEHWGGVADTRTLGIFLPPEFTDLKLECMAVKE